jgi:hypothetical protein
MGSSYRKSDMVFVQRVWVYRNHWKKEEEEDEEEEKRKKERKTFPILVLLRRDR